MMRILSSRKVYVTSNRRPSTIPRLQPRLRRQLVGADGGECLLDRRGADSGRGVGFGSGGGEQRQVAEQGLAIGRLALALLEQGQHLGGARRHGARQADRK